MTAAGPGPVRVAARTGQFTVGRAVEFDADSRATSALEYWLGAAGAELVAGFRAAAKRRRLVVDAVEALVTGELEHALTYLEVVGESGEPRIVRIEVKVFVASPEPPERIRTVFDGAVRRLPIAGTLRPLVDLDIDLVLTS